MPARCPFSSYDDLELNVVDNSRDCLFVCVLFFSLFLLKVYVSGRGYKGEEKSLIDLVDTVDSEFTQYTWIGVSLELSNFFTHDLSIPLFPNSKTTATKVEVRVHLLHAESRLACYIGRSCLSFHPSHSLTNSLTH